MFCTNCGAQVPDGSKFCPGCGKPMQAVEPEVRHCPACGAVVEAEAIFCPDCGVETQPGRGEGAPSAAGQGPTTYQPLGSGMRGESHKAAKTQIFWGKGRYASETAGAVEALLRSRSLNTQIVEPGDGSFVVQGASTSGLVRKALGLDMAVTVSVRAEGNELKVEIGQGKWLDKAAGAAIGWFIFWPALLTAGYGVYQQQHLYTEIMNQVASFLAAKP